MIIRILHLHCTHTLNYLIILGFEVAPASERNNRKNRFKCIIGFNSGLANHTSPKKGHLREKKRTSTEPIKKKKDKIFQRLFRLKFNKNLNFTCIFHIR